MARPSPPLRLACLLALALTACPCASQPTCSVDVNSTLATAFPAAAAGTYDVTFVCEFFQTQLVSIASSGQALARAELYEGASDVYSLMMCTTTGAWWIAGCYSSPGVPFSGCTCHTDCAVCGYGASVTAAENCVLCADNNASLFVMTPNGAGKCVTNGSLACPAGTGAAIQRSVDAEAVMNTSVACEITVNLLGLSDLACDAACKSETTALRALLECPDFTFAPTQAPCPSTAMSLMFQNMTADTLSNASSLCSVTVDVLGLTDAECDTNCKAEATSLRTVLDCPDFTFSPTQSRCPGGAVNVVLQNVTTDAATFVPSMCSAMATLMQLTDAACDSDCKIDAANLQTLLECPAAVTSSPTQVWCTASVGTVFGSLPAEALNDTVLLCQSLTSLLAMTPTDCDADCKDQALALMGLLDCATAAPTFSPHEACTSGMDAFLSTIIDGSVPQGQELNVMCTLLHAGLYNAWECDAACKAEIPGWLTALACEPMTFTPTAAPTATVTAAPTIACPAIDTSDNNFCNTVKRLHDSGQCTQTCAAQLLEIKLTLPTCLWTCAGGCFSVDDWKATAQYNEYADPVHNLCLYLYSLGNNTDAQALLPMYNCHSGTPQNGIPVGEDLDYFYDYDDFCAAFPESPGWSATLEPMFNRSHHEPGMEMHDRVCETTFALRRNRLSCDAACQLVLDEFYSLNMYCVDPGQEESCTVQAGIAATLLDFTYQNETHLTQSFCDALTRLRRQQGGVVCDGACQAELDALYINFGGVCRDRGIDQCPICTSEDMAYGDGRDAATDPYDRNDVCAFLEMKRSQNFTVCNQQCYNDTSALYQVYTECTDPNPPCEDCSMVNLYMDAFSAASFGYEELCSMLDSFSQGAHQQYCDATCREQLPRLYVMFPSCAPTLSPTTESPTATSPTTISPTTASPTSSPTTESPTSSPTFECQECVPGLESLVSGTVEFDDVRLCELLSQLRLDKDNCDHDCQYQVGLLYTAFPFCQECSVDGQSCAEINVVVDALAVAAVGFGATDMCNVLFEALQGSGKCTSEPCSTDVETMLDMFPGCYNDATTCFSTDGSTSAFECPYRTLSCHCPPSATEAMEWNIFKGGDRNDESNFDTWYSCPPSNPSEVELVTNCPASIVDSGPK